MQRSGCRGTSGRRDELTASPWSGEGSLGVRGAAVRGGCSRAGDPPKQTLRNSSVGGSLQEEETVSLKCERQEEERRERMWEGRAG